MERNFLLLIFLLFSPLVGGEQFVFSARISTDNHVLVAQELSLAPLMVSRQVVRQDICFIEAKKKKTGNTIAYLEEHKGELFECFLKENVLVFDDVSQADYLARSITHIQVLPVRFTVDFKDDFANISLLWSDK